MVVSDPGFSWGRGFTLQVPVSDPYDQLSKGVIDRESAENRRRLK